MERSLNVLHRNERVILDSNERKKMYYIVFLIVISRILFFLILFLLESTTGLQFADDSIYLQYDGQHYYNIAMNGYTKDYEYAFFPLFPIIIRLFGYLSVAIHGTIIFNYILTLFNAFGLYLIGTKVMKKNATVCLEMSVLWIFSPLAIATCVLYSEALFIFLTLTTYYLYKTDRLLLAGIALGLSIATRSLGSLLFFSIFIIMVFNILKNHECSKWEQIKNIFILFIPATVIAVMYPIYLYVKLGNWHYFLDVQYLYWSKVKTNIIEMIVNDFSNFHQMNFIAVYTYISLGICIYILYNAVKSKEDPILIIYLILSILMIFSTSKHTEGAASASFYRYLFGCSSVYLLINDNVKMKPLIIVTTIMSIFAIIYFCGGGFLI